ncbi:hypothetical protein HYFRA_00012571 [Hymenoscyphus fraxineus]|uniref:Small secreted protein n=1 Tax=Hymenoscyphus fraxineus TaxID=746836 RepID=A0A9N9PXU2_9HELO|nr:hypothetical protein HYFRA_00012571 [Hymenoscyphus fraxineus]
MHFSSSILAIVLALTSTAVCAPLDRRALTAKSYNDFQVSGGVGGNALAEANAQFPVGTNFKAVSKEDLKIISEAAQVSEQAEVAKGGFNDAIKAKPDNKAKAVGKTKNKVLKLMTDVLRLEIQAAQGKTGLESQIETQKKKLATNVKLDVANKGKKSEGINFSG